MLTGLVRNAVATSLLWTAVQGPPPLRMPPAGRTATQSATQPISPVAVMTWMTRYGSDGVHTLDLIVVWRGNPGWFMRGSHQSTSGGGSAGTVRQTLRYGDLQLEVAFQSTKRTADIQGKVVELGDANVILVDHVDSAEGPRVVSTLRIDGEVPSGIDRPTLCAGAWEGAAVGEVHLVALRFFDRDCCAHRRVRKRAGLCRRQPHDGR